MIKIEYRVVTLCRCRLGFAETLGVLGKSESFVFLSLGLTFNYQLNCVAGVCEDRLGSCTDLYTGDQSSNYLKFVSDNRVITREKRFD